MRKPFAIILMILGILLTLIGAMFKILHWPDLFLGTISGPIVLLAGIFLLVFTKKKTKKSQNHQP